MLLTFQKLLAEILLTEILHNSLRKSSEFYATKNILFTEILFILSFLSLFVKAKK